jgi:hypothetical protein
VAYVVIEDFRFGMDTRNPAVVGTPGSLTLLRNAHITSGGRIQRSRRFEATYTVPASTTFGLHAQGDNLYTFGGLTEPSGLSDGVIYQRLSHPDTTTEITKIHYTDNFDGKIYAIAEFADGEVYHYYDGARVTDWDSLGSPIDSNEGIAQVLLEKISLDEDYVVTRIGAVLTIEAAATNTPFTITGGTVDGGEIDDQDITLTQIDAAAEGVKEKWTAEIEGTFEADDLFTLTIDDVDYATSAQSAGAGRTALTFKTKMYSTCRSLLRFSAINDPTDLTAGTGFGFLNLSNANSGSEVLTAIGKYAGDLALFSRSAIQVQYVDVDEDLNESLHTIEGTGTRSPRSVTPFGNTDLLYLDERTGVRSLRSRAQADAPSVDDIGAPIDDDILAWMISLPVHKIPEAIGLIADEGRFWLIIGTRIYVYSYFKSSKIGAWSYYVPGFAINAAATIGRHIYVRSGSTVYKYGGKSGANWPNPGEAEVTVTTPFMSLKKPATVKTLLALDIAGENTWQVSVLTDPDDLTQKTSAIALTDTTYLADIQAAMDIRCTHFALEFTCDEVGRAELYEATVHYDMNEAS